MVMVHPPHPGKGLKEDLDALGLSPDEAAGALGVTAEALYGVLHGSQGLSPEMALRLERVIGSTADHWMRLQAAYDLDQARRAKAEELTELRRLRPPAAAPGL